VFVFDAGILFDTEAIQAQAAVRYEIERYNNGSSTPFKLDKYEKFVDVEESIDLSKAGDRCQHTLFLGLSRSP
jgi:hypothetical protein